MFTFPEDQVQKQQLSVSLPFTEGFIQTHSTGKTIKTGQKVGWKVQKSKDMNSCHHPLCGFSPCVLYACAYEDATCVRARGPLSLRLSLARDREVMSTSGTKETCILEDPNAVGHMDALFDVLRKPNNGGTGAGRSASSKRNSRSNSGNNRKAASAAAELVCGGPTADVEFLLDALFAVVETDSGSGRGGGRRRPGRAAAATAMARGAAAAKSWKERKLPASFFDAGGGVSTGPSAGKEEALDAAEGIEDGSPIPSPDSESSRQVTNSSSHPGLAQLPVVLVNTSSTESLTFYIE